MPVTQQGQGAASVSVAVPVPTPVVPKPKPKSQPAVVPQPQPVPAPVPMGPSPVSFDQQQPMAGVQAPRPPMSAVVMPWSPAPTQAQAQRMSRLPRKVVRYAGDRPKVSPQVPQEAMFPQELRDLEGGPHAKIKELNAGVKQGLADKPGFYPGKTELKALAQVGEPARGGYAEQYRSMEQLLGRPEDANRWTVINAILSPQESWVGHSRAAIEALSKWHDAGRPTDLPSLDKVFGTSRKVGANLLWNRDGTFVGARLTNGQKIETIKRFLSSENSGSLEWPHISRESYKTPNFGLAFADPRGTPIDTHMARLLTPGRPFHLSKLHEMARGVGADAGTLAKLKDVRDKVVGRTPVHVAYKSLLAHAAKELGWEPREVQEAVWTAVVAVMVAKHLGATPKAESILGKLNRRAIQAGWSIKTVLEDAGVKTDLSRLGVGPRRVKNVVVTGQNRRPEGRGPVSTEHTSALESAASRLGSTVPDAGEPIRDVLLGKLSRRIRAGQHQKSKATTKVTPPVPEQMGRKSPRRYAGETTEDHFHQMLDANPEDHQTRMILADYLEERGDPRAAGYRAMGKLARFPGKGASNFYGDASIPNMSDSRYHHALLPTDWYKLLIADKWGVSDKWKWFGSSLDRRKADDAAALAFSKLPPERQHEIMNGPPQQMRRLPKRVVRYVNSKR